MLHAGLGMSMFHRISMLSPFLEYHFFHFVAFLKRIQHSHVSKLVIDLLNCAEQLLLSIFLIFGRLRFDIGMFRLMTFTGHVSIVPRLLYFL